MPDLRTVIVMDCQNVHLTGHGRFRSTRYGPKHDALVDPLHFANQLLRVRSARQRDGRPSAILCAVDVYRGLPSSEHDPNVYARNLAQKAPVGAGHAGDGDPPPAALSLPARLQRSACP